MKSIWALLVRHDVAAISLNFALITRIERLNWYFKIGSNSVFERVLTQARARARQRARALFGTSASIKSLLLLKTHPVEACSMMLSGFVSAHNSEVINRLKRTGACILCNTNMDEFGIGYSGSACAHGYIINAWARAVYQLTREVLLSGGSSGGCAIAVALRICNIGLATDTGGSVRQPASYIGIIGLKPSYGRCSRWGVLAYASSLDQVGVLARGVNDCARICTVAFGVDSKDWTSVSLPVPKYELYVGSVSRRARALVFRQYTPARNAAPWVYCLSALERIELKLIDVHMPFLSVVLPCYLVLSSVECYSNLSKYNGIRFGLRFRESDAFALYKKLRTVAYGFEVKRKLLTGAYLLSVRSGHEQYYLKAQRLRFIIKSCILDRLRQNDVVVLPSVPASALGISGWSELNSLADVYTVLSSLTGLPSVSVPVCFGVKGLPFGIQLVASSYNELRLMVLGAKLARVCGVLSLCR
ncbi:amidase family protein [Candidatus Hodgkinia cicadicola]